MPPRKIFGICFFVSTLATSMVLAAIIIALMDGRPAPNLLTPLIALNITSIFLFVLYLSAKRKDKDAENE